MRSGGRRVRSGSLRSLGCALGVVGFVWVPGFIEVRFGIYLVLLELLGSLGYPLVVVVFVRCR